MKLTSDVCQKPPFERVLAGDLGLYLLSIVSWMVLIAPALLSCITGDDADSRSTTHVIVFILGYVVIGAGYQCLPTHDYASSRYALDLLYPSRLSAQRHTVPMSG